MTRRFSVRQRAALYLAADGRCSSCGCELASAWHADHMDPWSAGGDTDVTNGQALCPLCNYKKGTSVAGLRQWQQDAIDSFHAHNDRDFLVSATPGAGKTTFGLELARQLLDAGDIRRIAVIVPTDSLRQQWADEAGRLGIHLMPATDAEDYDKAGYLGYVATYQQLGTGAGADLARRATRHPTLAILDEIHHAGESRAWGNGLSHAMEHAATRVALTGTPWRQDKDSPIPFVKYGDDGRVRVDAGYEYGEAVADGVCRPLEFHAYDGDARWRDCGVAKSATLGADLPDEDVPAAMDAVLNPRYDWIPGLLTSASQALDEIRADVHDAAGLVVAHEQWHARAYAAILERITGEAPTVVVSDDPDSKANLDAFRTARSRWIVAVKMVSEGVDIPRLAVGVYASKVKTPLFFRQVAGRFVRQRPNEELNARLYIPALPTLMDHARQVEDELRHQLNMEKERDDRDRKEGGGQSELPLRESIGATEAVFDTAIYQGSDINPTDYAQAEERCRAYGIPLGFASNVARMMRDQSETPAIPQPEAEPQKDQIPRHRVEKMLRSDVTRLSNKVARRIGGGANLGDASREVNTRLLKAGFPSRAKASVDQLEQIRDYLVRWLDGLS